MTVPSTHHAGSISPQTHSNSFSDEHGREREYDQVTVLPLDPIRDESSTILIEDGSASVQRTLLRRGTRVITQHIPAARSVAIGLWVPVGSRDETPEHAGSTHFLEHLLFKGTKTRSALDIAIAFDTVGGETNAETAKEYTQYYARVRKEDLAMAVEILTDQVTSSVIDLDAFNLEKGVILDELAISEDSPAEVVHNGFATAVFGDQPLGRPVGGTPQVIEDVSREAVWEHYQSHYGPDNLIIAAAGAVDHDELVGMVSAALDRADWVGRANADGLYHARPHRQTGGFHVDTSVIGDHTRRRDVEQAHVIVGSPSLRADTDKAPIMSVLLMILGGSMSSRLFQEVREKRGLAYTTYAFDSTYADAGAFGMYAGTSVDNVHEVEKLMIGQLEDLAENGPLQEELHRVQGHLLGSVTLGLEDYWSRMARLGRFEMRGYYRSIPTMLARFNSVSAEDVQEMATFLAQAPRARSYVLPNR